MSKINVKAKAERGFYRAGLFFTREGVDLETAELSKEQLRAIQEEPNLTVVEVGESDADRSKREKAEAAAADKARRDAEAKKKAEANAIEQANKAALAREKAATKKPEDKAAWEAAEDAAREVAQLVPEAWAALPASDRVARIEAKIAEGAK